MNIRTRLIISIIVSVLMIAIVGTMLFFNYQQLSIASENARLTDDIVQGAFSLGSLQNDYLMDPSDRARLQWEEKYATLQDEFSQLRISDPVQQETLESILECNLQLREQFSRIIASPGSTGSSNGNPDPELVRARWNRLGIQTQEMIFGASRLSGLVGGDVVRIQQENNRLIIILVSALLIVILMNFFLVTRHILRSLESFRSGTGIIGSGNLDFALDESSRDEIGDLSHAFNRMTSNLKAVTASKADLELEIFERKMAEAALRESEDRFRKIFVNSPIGMVLVTPDFRFFSVNPAWISMTGYTEEELLTRSFKDITHPDHIAGDMEHIRKLVAGTIPVYCTEKRYIRKDGSILWGLIRVTTLSDTEGSLRFFAAQIEDITERKAAEDALKKRTEELDNKNQIISTLLDTVPIGVFMVEAPSGKPIIANPEATRLLGRGILPDTNEANLAEVYEAYKAGTAERYPSDEMPVIKGMSGESSHIDDMLVVRPDNTRINLEIFGKPVTDHEGHVVASLVSFLDITERKRSEEQQAALLQELARKNAELDRFTHTISHDLKSPLVTIRGFLGLLEEDMQKHDAVQVHSDMAHISKAADTMEHLIVTLLDLSRSGRSVDTPVRIAFTELAREGAGLLATSLTQHHATMVIPDNLPVISGDRHRLLQVMTNLYDNALKYMGDQQEPRVETGVRYDAGTPVFFVKDNGMGIRKEDQSRVFALFERLDTGIPGTGIGLATVKRIIEAHGGKIWVESEGEGKGTTVCFTVPGVVEDTYEERDRAKEDGYQNYGNW